MSRSKQYIKDVSVLVWQHLYDHPEIKYKTGLPDEIYNKIKNSEYECLLCDKYNDIDKGDGCCPRCPLSCCVETKDSIYLKWYNARTKKSRKKYAGIILEQLKAWDTTKIIRVK